LVDAWRGKRKDLKGEKNEKRRNDLKKLRTRRTTGKVALIIPYFQCPTWRETKKSSAPFDEAVFLAYRYELVREVCLPLFITSLYNCL
jgi:hypothetical protein